MSAMKNQKGFSMIELMMVVTIIGVLTVIGVPQYQKFQMKAKQSEAKSLLGGMYSSQKAFFAEWNQYYGDFNAVGFGVDGNLGYVVGFNGPGTAGPVNHPTPAYAGAAPLVRDADAYCSAAVNNCDIRNARVGVAVLPASSAELNTFTFAAAANIDSDPTVDRWTIDENRRLEQQIAWNDITN